MRSNLALRSDLSSFGETKPPHGKESPRSANSAPTVIGDRGARPELGLDRLAAHLEQPDHPMPVWPHRFEVLDLITGSVVTTFKSASSWPNRTIIHPDGKRVISTYGSGRAHVWEMTTGEILWQTDQNQDPGATIVSVAAAVSPDGR